MKLITLNTWGGRALHPLIHFFKRHAAETDVFCLQEMFDAPQELITERHPEEFVHGDLFKKLVAELKDFDGHLAVFEDRPTRQTLAMFIRKGLPVKKVDDFLVYVPDEPKETGSTVISSRKLQYAIIEHDGKELLVANFHGLFNAGPKTDTPERIAQSGKIQEFMDKHSGPALLAGDFNLLPETVSLQMLEKNKRNLVRESGVASTRTLLYRHYMNPAEPNFADYILVSPEINVRHFEVMPDIVSDHAALFIDFSV